MAVKVTLQIKLSQAVIDKWTWVNPDVIQATLDNCSKVFYLRTLKLFIILLRIRKYFFSLTYLLGFKWTFTVL